MKVTKQIDGKEYVYITSYLEIISDITSHHKLFEDLRLIGGSSTVIFDLLRLNANLQVELIELMTKEILNPEQQNRVMEITIEMNILLYRITIIMDSTVPDMKSIVESLIEKKKCELTFLQKASLKKP